MMITRETTELRNLDYHTGQTILLDKPFKWTSFKVVALVRKYCGAKKVGHSGTLDPLATGLLIIKTGKKTKELEDYIGLDKTYKGTFILGQFSKTFDLEGEVQNVQIPAGIDKNKILEVKNKFIGEIYQTPPMFSAKKIKGKRLYKFARKGKDITVEPRKVTIYEFDLTSVQIPEITFRIKCSKGTYIRSIAADFGKELGTSAVLGSLRRIKIGEFDVEDALTVDEFLDRIGVYGAGTK
ncbi:MAG TPA: tRNA pseudouridine(55) synthase TruB [Ignavibacteriaceae bacterium]|nr:tRNA pseudouridine(55) synthase TruB [Ignavibacteriaceae bacterium]